jgi:uncharacterized membrane protein YphA (DoxX/SURF4 family)
MSKLTFTSICRIIVGTIFVLSGLIKANDPYGTGYKLEEYFEVFSQDIGSKKVEKPTEVPEDIKASPCFSKLNFPKEYEYQEIPKEQLGGFKRFLLKVFKYFHDHAFQLSLFVTTLEVILGMLILFGINMRLTTWLLLGMTVFFAFLTFYSAQYNKVTDCGCFGDAIKFTPWQSFWKDIILMIFLLPLFIWNRQIKGSKFTKYEVMVAVGSIILITILVILQFHWWFPVIFIGAFMLAKLVSGKFSDSKFQPHVSTLAIIISCSFFTWYSTQHMPLKDYRPWAPGNNIREQLVSVAEQAEVEMVYLNKTTCEEVHQSTKDWSWFDSTFEASHIFYKQDKKVIKPAIEPKIKDFRLEDPETGMLMADSLVKNPGYTFLWVGYNVEKTCTKNMDKIQAIADYCAKNNIFMLGGSASTSDKIDKFRHDHNIMFKIYQNDEKALKTILRSNPGLVLIKDGIVIDKWHYNDFPTVEKLQKKYLK